MADEGSAKLAQILLKKAANEIVEKSIKAVLVARGVEYRFSHDLSYLNDLLEENGVAVPQELRDAELLRPWAMEFRYEDPSRADTRLDRAMAQHQARFAHAWAAEAVP